MGIYSIKPAFQRRLLVARDFFIRRKVSADSLTTLAVVLSVSGGTLIAITGEGSPWLLLIPLLALGRISLNALDGMVAIATGTARRFGELLNESADRISDVAWFAGLAFVSDERLALGSLVMVIFTSHVGTAAKAAGGLRQYGGIMGKADRMILLSVASVTAVAVGNRAFTVFLYVVALGSAVTLVQRFSAARADLSAREPR